VTPALPLPARATGGRHARNHQQGLARLWSLLWLPVVAAGLGGVLGVALSFAGAPSWQAEATVTFSPPSQDPLLFPAANPASAARELADATALAVSEEVLAPAAAALDGVEDWTDLRDTVTVTPVPGSSVISVAATAPDEEAAAATVEAVVAAFAQAARDGVVEAARRAAAAVTADGVTAGGEVVEDVLARAEILALTADPIRVLTTSPPEQTAPAPVRNGATGVVLGIILAAAYLAVRIARPSRVTSGSDVGELLQLPSGAIRAGQVVPGSERLIEDLQHLSAGSPARLLLVVPAGPASVGAAQEVAAVLRDTIPAHRVADEHVPQDAGGPAGPEGSGGTWVQATGDPTGTIVAPLAREATAVILAVQSGAPVREVRTAERLTRQWERAPDAVILMED
jgi:capsular polysaccharide biosynthesis protein